MNFCDSTIDTNTSASEELFIYNNYFLRNYINTSTESTYYSLNCIDMIFLQTETPYAVCRETPPH